MIRDTGEESVFVGSNRLLKNWIPFNFNIRFPHFLPSSSILVLENSKAVGGGLLGFCECVSLRRCGVAACYYGYIFSKCATLSRLGVAANFFYGHAGTNRILFKS